MVTIGPKAFDGPSTKFYADFVLYDQDKANNRSRVKVTIRCYNGDSGSTGSYYGGAGTHWGGIDSYDSIVEEHAASSNFLPSGYGQGALRWSENSVSGYITHDSNGNRTVTCRMRVDYGSIDQQYTVSLALPRIAKAPAQVTGLVLSAASTTGMKATWTAPNNNGASITGYDLDYALDSGFTSGKVTKALGTGLSYDLTGLNPGTKYYVRVRAKNSAGTGSNSATASLDTLPSVPPGLVVASSPSGASATLTFSPPGGISGVDKYTWERRKNGTTTPVSTADSTVTVVTVGGLTPGTKYDWRASAWIGTYQTPWSTWQTLQQAKPNIDPGDYFDGSTEDTADLNYGWTGTADGSTSQATASGVDGWQAFFNSGSSGVLYRVTAGIFSVYAARVQFTGDSTAPGARFGQKGNAPFQTEVTADATYVGSIHVRPSRGQSLAAELSWVDAAGALISRLTGATTDVPGGEWLRLAVGGVAPTGAKAALIRVIDVAGAGWSPWLGGDVMDLDGAMISLNEEFPYFDGNTLVDGDYVYEWTATPNASTSTRTPIDQVDLETVVFGPGALRPGALALVDPNCIPPTPPRPPVVPSDCIEKVGVWRRYYTKIPSNLVSDWLDMVPTLEIVSGASASKQVRVRWYPNPDDLLPEQINTSTWIAEQIISYQPAHTVMTLDGVTQRVWAEINGGAPVPANHLLYGTNGRPAVWPVLSCGISYVISVEVPTADPPGNIVTHVALTART